jgi:hypothetical protein
MKIGYVMHKGGTNGGFPQHAETIIHALKKLGHKVEFLLIAYLDKVNVDFYKNKIKDYHEGRLLKEGSPIKITKGIGTGLYYEPEGGWITPPIPYKTSDQKKALKMKLESFDAVFWHTPFWFKQKESLLDTEWPMLLDLQNPVNIGFVHDANLRSNCAWMHFIDKYFDKIITVHPASYNSASMLKTARCMIFNPQDMSCVDRNKNNFHTLKENKLLFSLNNWKASKHIDDLLRASGHFSSGIKSIVAGGGIEFRYLCATDKCKEEYYTNKKYDPDLKDEYVKNPIRLYDYSLKNNCEFPIWLTEKERDDILGRTSFYVDTAWYQINKEIGSHFSRTLVEAMMHGVVPIARNLGLSNNEEGIGEIFKPNENYIMIPWNASPKEFAEIVNKSFNMSEREYNRIVQNNYDLLEHFDMMNVARQYEDVIEGKPTGWFGKYETGTPNKKFIQKAEEQWYGTGENRTFSFKNPNEEKYEDFDLF